VCETNDTKVTIQDGASPYMVTFNVPSWVQGSAASNTTAKSPKISYDYFTCTVEGGALTGTTRVVKQGDGILTFPAVDMTYTGETNIWNGTFNINGSLANSPVWLNRFAVLNTPAKAITLKSLKADYGSEITIGGAGAIGELTSTESVTLGIGSRISFDIYSEGFNADKLNTAKLVVEKKDWKYGPKYLIPVFEFVTHPAAGEENIAPGTYCLGKIGAVTGNLSDIKIEGISKLKASLSINDNNELLLTLSGVRDAGDIKWNGNISSVWDYADTENFLSNDQTQTPEIFVEGDKVHFTDEAQNFSVNIKEGQEMKVDTIFFDNKVKSYTLGGNGIITKGNFVKSGEGTVKITGDHTYSGEVHLRGGTTTVSSLSSSTQAYGNLGGVKSGISSFTIEDGAVLNVTAAVKNGSLIRVFAEGVITNTSTFTQEKAITGDTLIKRGGGYFDMQGSLMAKCLRVEGGTFNMGNSYTNKIILGGGGALSGGAFVSSPLEIKSGAKANLTTVDRATYSNTLSGNGQITVYSSAVAGSGWYATRTPLRLNMKSFGGTLVAQAVHSDDGRFTFDTANGSDSLTLNIPSGVIVQNTAKTLRIGKLTGSGSLGGYCAFDNNGSSGINTWQVGNDEDFTFNGGVVGSDKFVKKGKGTMTVGATSLWTTTGAVTIEEGEIKILTNGVSGKLGSLGTGVLTVAAGAKLSGFTTTSVATAENTPMTNSSYVINGTINPCNSGSIFGSSYANMGGKDVTINSGGKLEVMAGIVSRTARAAACLTNVKKMTMNDGAILSLTFSSTYNPATYVTSEDKSESFTVFQATSSSIGNIILNLPDLLPYSKNLYYDYSDINNGVITIRYREIAIKGDVNGDGIVNGTDIQAIINFIVGGQYDEKADVNEDGVVNGTDIQEIINIIVSTE
jgi:autotransporter-associated beta strand protein